MRKKTHIDLLMTYSDEKTFGVKDKEVSTPYDYDWFICVQAVWAMGINTEDKKDFTLRMSRKPFPGCFTVVVRQGHSSWNLNADILDKDGKVIYHGTNGLYLRTHEVIEQLAGEIEINQTVTGYIGLKPKKAGKAAATA
jgi:hypothetical protein